VRIGVRVLRIVTDEAWRSDWAGIVKYYFPVVLTSILVLNSAGPILSYSDL
jgi:hypothetical protein